MRVASRLRHSQMASMAGLLSAALLIAAPPPASADRDDWEDRYSSRSHRGHDHDRRDRHDRKHHSRHHRHGDWCPPQHFGRSHARHYSPRHYVRPARHRYYCEPCSGWYADRASFHYHVRHHHHVPLAVLPLVIAATVFGAVFAGY